MTLFRSASVDFDPMGRADDWGENDNLLMFNWPPTRGAVIGGGDAIDSALRRSAMLAIEP